MITSRAEYLKKAETWLRRIDMVGKATEKQVHVYHIQNRPAGELAQLLQKVYGQQEPAKGTAVRSHRRDHHHSPETQSRGRPPFQVAPGVPPPSSCGNEALPASRMSRSPASTRSRGTARALAPGTWSDDRFTGDIAIVPDETNNALIITATSQEYKRMRRILERIDVMPNQVLLEATIAEVTPHRRAEDGPALVLPDGQPSVQADRRSTGAVIAGLVAGLLVASSTRPTSRWCSMRWRTITDVNVVSSPTIMVIDNKRATLQVGDEVPIATQSAVSVLTPGAPIVNSVSFRNTGIILNITPRINDNGRVLLDIEQEVSDVVPTTTFEHRLADHPAAAHQDDGVGQRRRRHRARRPDAGPGHQHPRAGAAGRRHCRSSATCSRTRTTRSRAPSC